MASLRAVSSPWRQKPRHRLNRHFCKSPTVVAAHSRGWGTIVVTYYRGKLVPLSNYSARIMCMNRLVIGQMYSEAVFAAFLSRTILEKEGL